MILKNYWEALRLYVAEATEDNTSISYMNHGLKALAGTIASINHYTSTGTTINTSYTPNALKNMDLRKTNFEMRVGSGTAAPTATDYALGNDITSYFSNTSLQVDSISTTNGLQTTYIFSGTNSTSSDLTITEIGLAKKFLTTDHSTNGSVCLLTKNLLDNPITVAAGDNFTLTFEWVEG